MLIRVMPRVPCGVVRRRGHSAIREPVPPIRLAFKVRAVTRGALLSIDDLAALDELASAYLPLGMGRTDPRVSPLYADLKGFPPILVQVGAAETLLDDAVRLAAAAGAVDVPVTLQIWPHMIHAWPLWNAHLEAGRRALISAGSFIRSHI